MFTDKDKDKDKEKETEKAEYKNLPVVPEGIKIIVDLQPDYDLDAPPKKKIIVPDTVKEDPNKDKYKNEGVIVAKGPDCQLLNVGDKIAFGPHSGNPFVYRRKVFLLMKATDIYCQLPADYKIQYDYDKKEFIS